MWKKNLDIGQVGGWREGGETMEDLVTKGMVMEGIQSWARGREGIVRQWS